MLSMFSFSWIRTQNAHLSVLNDPVAAECGVGDVAEAERHLLVLQNLSGGYSALVWEPGTNTLKTIFAVRDSSTSLGKSFDN